MGRFQIIKTAERILRDLKRDPWTVRLFVALVAFDVFFVSISIAKAFELVSFNKGAGNVIIACQLALVALILLYGWWNRLNTALASLALVATVLALEKTFKFHLWLAYTVLRGAGLPVGTLVAGPMYYLLIGTLCVAILALGWRHSDTEGRAAILVVSVAFAVTAGTSVAADELSLFLGYLTPLPESVLSRGEQGLELLTSSALLALTFGVVRAEWLRRSIEVPETPRA
jgi:hypothetical protein